MHFVVKKKKRFPLGRLHDEQDLSSVNCLVFCTKIKPLLDHPLKSHNVAKQANVCWGNKIKNK